MPKGASDGQLVNIPARLPCYPSCANEISKRALLVWHCLYEVQQVPTEGQEFTWPTFVKSFPRKVLLSRHEGSVPETDTGG